MSETDSEQETEVFFRHPRREDSDRHCDEVTAGDEIQRDSSTDFKSLGPAVKQMIDMQASIFEALQGITQALTRLTPEPAHQQQINSNQNWSGRPVDSTSTSQDRCIPQIRLHSERPQENMGSLSCEPTVQTSPPRQSPQTEIQGGGDFDPATMERYHQLVNQQNQQVPSDCRFQYFCDDVHQNNRPRTQQSRLASGPSHLIKFPPFQGKEDWKTWINRFEAVAYRQGWDKDRKLDELLPQLQGCAGDFVFTQLRANVINDYYLLISELDSRFRVVESPKTYAAKFSCRDQKPGETVEEYAAELKRLYDKTHMGRRDHKTREEDLVRRFLDGLRDDDLRCEVEYVKDPTNIDDAVYYAVSLIHTRRNPKQAYNDKKFKEVLRSAQENDSSDCEDDPDYACQVQSGRRMCKGTTHEKEMKVAVDQDQPPAQAKDNSDILMLILDQLKNLAQSQTPHRHGKECFYCHQLGHFVKDCPETKQGTNGQGTSKMTSQTDKALNMNGLNLKARVKPQ